MEEILDYTSQLSKQSRTISNILQGDFWQQKFGNITGLVGTYLPVYIYYDEIECGNCLGSHAGKNKFGATYASLSCLLPRIASKIDSILLYSLINAEDKKLTTNENIFKNLVNELNELQRDGIYINDGIET